MQKRLSGNAEIFSLERPQKRWSLKYLREQFTELEDIYIAYILRLSHGYFSLFLIMQFCLSTSYVLILYFEYTKISSKKLENIIPDLILNVATAIIPVIPLFLFTDERLMKKSARNAKNAENGENNIVVVGENDESDENIKNARKAKIAENAKKARKSENTKKRNLLRNCSLIAYVLIYIVNTSLPIYHFLARAEYYQSPYTTHLIIACYIFFSIGSLGIAFIAALFATLTHLLLCALFQFEDYPTQVLIRRLIIEVIYYGCVNFLGVYFRYMNEIRNRRSFLDRKDVTNMKIKFNVEKKQRENLLTAIIPSNIYQKILHHERLSKILDNSQNLLTGQNVFSYKEEFLFEHKDVTILYADIVNYTEMTTRITPATKLVEVLNDLFGSFDNDSEKLNVTRIKFLGDCYYCVSGLQPNPNPNHADACVQLGLRMIETIKNVSENKQIDLNMRIGIHTGNIFTGIIGLTKWQLEIWSNDVHIANKMESSGFPGRVHLTKQTKDQLKQKYHITATNAFEQDEYLRKYIKDTKTYVISPEPTEETFLDVHTANRQTKKSEKQQFQRRTASSLKLFNEQMNAASRILQQKLSNDKIDSTTADGRVSYNANRRLPVNINRRSASTVNPDETVVVFRELEIETAVELSTVIKEMPLSKYAQWFQVKDINPALLIFKNLKMELTYLLLPDPLFKYYIMSCLVVLLCFISIRYIAMPEWEYTTLLSLITSLIFIVLAPILWLPEKKPVKREAELDQVEFYKGYEISKWQSAVPNIFYQISGQFINNPLLRTAMYILFCFIFTGCFVVELTHCDYHHFNVSNTMFIKSANLYDNGNADGKCLLPWNITETISLTLMLSFLFLKIHVWLKFVFASIVTVAYSYWVWKHAYDYFEKVETFNYMMKAPIAHIISVVYLTFTLHLIDRQADYMNRLDHKWNEQLIIETERAAEMRESNQRLLANVMPLDIAEKYYKKSREDGEKKFYCEPYASAAVMFATVVNIDEGDDPKLFLTIMNEIISDFDRVLQMERYKNKIEKIKLANWTYVACSGLTPGKTREYEDTEDDAEKGTRSKEKQENDKNLILLLEFAVDIRKALIKHNKECNYDIQLRIGICDGELTAGVVGTKKPHYDIWGDPVNMASRMDTTGTPGCIQVWESTEMVLRRNDICCDRNEQFTYVKGKSDISTYNIRLNEFNDLVKITDVKEDDEEEEEEEDY